MSDQKKILIVDDVEANRFVLRNIISDMGYLPVLAENGIQTLKIMEHIKPNLILLDVAMPQMDGFELCGILKNDPLTREIPVIFISAFDSPDDITKGFSVGGEDYITKPFDPDVLLAKVNAIIRRNYGELKPENADHGEEKCGVILWENRQTVACRGKQTELSFTENSLFRVLFAAFPDAVSRGELFMQVWDDDSFVEENTLNVNIRRLREKFVAAGLPIAIRVVRSFGYKLIIGGDNT